MPGFETYTAATDVTDDDLFLALDNPSGTPATKKITALVGRKYFAGAHGINVKDYGATGNGKIVTDGAITSGSATLTSATASFTSADAGKTVAVVGAGAAGALLYTTISGFTNSTTVTLAATAGTTVSVATVTYGTDDGPAIQTAINAMPAAVIGISGLPTLFFPVGVYLTNTATLTGLAGGCRVMGAGRGSSVVVTAAGTHDMWTLGNFSARLQFDQISLRSHAGGGHIFNQSNTVQYSGLRNCSLYQLNPAKSIWKQGSGQPFNYNFWQDCYLQHTGATSVPALDFTAGTGSAFTGNTWDHVVFATDPTAATWFADFATTLNTYDDNVFRDLICQATNGGVARIRNGGAWVFDNVHIESLTTTVNDLFWVGQGAGAVASSRNIFRRVMRRGTGTLGSALTDIFLESGSKATDTKIEHCDQVGSASAFTVNINSNPDVLALGCRNVTFQNPGTRFVNPSLPSRATFSNAAYTATSSDRTVAQTGTLSAARVVTLPAANSVPPGTQLLLIDESGTATATFTLSWARAGSDTINGAASNVVAVNAAYGSGLIESDGTSKWTTIALGGSSGSSSGALTNTGGGKATYTNIGNMGATPTLNLATANAFRGTLNANCAPVFTGATNGVECTLAFTVVHDATSNAYSITWQSGVKWPNGNEPPRDTTTPGTRTRYVFVSEDGGTTWDGNMFGGNFA